MFLDCYLERSELHELDFRFELGEGGGEFLFASHGLNLSDLAETIDLASFGTSFYMVDAHQPVTLDAFIADPGLFEKLYHVRPTEIRDRFLSFDLAAVTQFFRNTREENELDCVILGVHDALMADGEFERILTDTLDQIEHHPPSFVWKGSWLHTHDNHFFWMQGQSPELLRRLIAESVLGFFHHMEPRCRTPVPDTLVDLLLSEYHTAPLICFPTEWAKDGEVFVCVQREEDRISALLETAADSWIAHRLHPPADLVGRALYVTHDLGAGAWSFERWR